MGPTTVLQFIFWTPCFYPLFFLLHFITTIFSFNKMVSIIKSSSHFWFYPSFLAFLNSIKNKNNSKIWHKDKIHIREIQTLSKNSKIGSTKSNFIFIMQIFNQCPFRNIMHGFSTMHGFNNRNRLA